MYVVVIVPVIVKCVIVNVILTCIWLLTITLLSYDYQYRNKEITTKTTS